MKTSTAISNRLAAAGVERTSPGAIYAVVMDAHAVHCLEESHLDAWWASLAPERKAEIYEADLEGEIASHSPELLGLEPIPPSRPDVSITQTVAFHQNFVLREVTHASV